ncbi:MAG: UvrD-helicase domain-containing protein [Lachnospiraceae bacterium]|nr:UvrD-helicase domain-containing protein [Lachnospiraceae bacterium]
MEIDKKEIEIVEKILLAKDCHFPSDARDVIRCWESADVSACPGSGKTTVLLAKLKLLADRMPLQSGSGVCVLSHTNVAINEIKTKLADYADLLMSYPNYVGTIQSFIDQFVTKPYLKHKTDISIQVVEDSVYAQHLYKLLWKDRSQKSPYQKIRYFIKYNVKNGSGQYGDEISYMENLYQKDGALYASKQKKPLAGADSLSAKQYEAAVQELLTLEGLIRYKDAYQYAVESIRELSTEYTDLFSRRFQYVFIDEYQDCNQMQRDALDKLFDQNKCCVFHIGDSDQAIYNSDNSGTEDWKPATNCLPMASSNRYGQEIADVLTNLRTDKEVINASLGKTGYIPTVIIFDDASIDKVVGKYILALDENELYDPNGIYKIIGAVKKRDLTGLKISDYWTEYDDSSNLKSEYNYWSYVRRISEGLLAGKLYYVEGQFRSLLCKILHYAGVKNKVSGREYTYKTIKKRIDEEHFEHYRNDWIQITKLKSHDIKSVDAAIRMLLGDLIDFKGKTEDDFFGLFPEYFMREGDLEGNKQGNRNFFIEPIRGRKIEIDTVHGVKGETHDATLYLETEKSRSSDIRRILPYWGIGKKGSQAISEYSRKCVYVGMSRPRKLLCLAVRAETYEEGKKAFESWKVMDCRV